MKIGIISEFNTDTVNFGNQLQAFALNYYLRNHCSVECVESIVLCGNKGLRKHTNLLHPAVMKSVVWHVQRLVGYENKPFMDHTMIQSRKEQFKSFRENHIPMSTMTIEDLQNADYDVFVVGSDVIWRQEPIAVNRVAFLDFTAKKPFKRIAYAPSFAGDYMPWWNMRHVRKYLGAFEAVSVRENSSVAKLKEHGITGVSYCVDPTLLLTQEEWSLLERQPDEIQEENKYLFAYMLGRNSEQRRYVADLANRMKLTLVTVPHAGEIYVPSDVTLPGVKIDACSIENWLWLIHHAQIVVTDSFHGTVFSTIFQKQFVVLEREMEDIDINNRMTDYLHQIGQEDKALPADRLEEVDSFVWDYDQIGEAISIRRQNSIQFLKNALGD